MIEFPVFLVFFSAIQLHFTSHITPCQTSRFLTQYITWIVSNRSHAWHFSQLSQDLYFVSNLCMIGMSHDPHGKSHMNDMYCHMTFTWSTYCVQLYLDPHVHCYTRSSTVSHLSVCHMWYDVSSNCHMADQQLSHGWQPVLNDQHGVSHLSILLFESEPLW